MPRAFVFRYQEGICKCSLEPTTRLVLFALSTHAGGDSKACFPSQATLATETGLAERTVGQHIGKAVQAGWLTKEKRSRNGRQWPHNE